MPQPTTTHSSENDITPSSSEIPNFVLSNSREEMLELPSNSTTLRRVPLLNIIASMKSKSNQHPSGSGITNHQHNFSFSGGQLLHDLSSERERSNSLPSVMSTTTDHSVDEPRIFPSPIKADKHVFILGDNQCGKSTLLRSLLLQSQNVEEFINEFTSTSYVEIGKKRSNSFLEVGGDNGESSELSPSSLTTGAVSPRLNVATTTPSPVASDSGTPSPGKFSQWISSLRSSKSNNIL